MDCKLTSNQTSGEGDCIIVLIAETGGYMQPAERERTAWVGYGVPQQETLSPETMLGAACGVAFALLFMLAALFAGLAARRRR